MKNEDTNASIEDLKELFARAYVKHIHFTINEWMEVIGNHYENVPIEELDFFAPDVEVKIRKDVYEFILHSKKRIDPATFNLDKYCKSVAAVQHDVTGESGLSAEEWGNKVIDIINETNSEKQKVIE